MKLFFLIICSFFHITVQNPTDFWTLLPNVLVLEVTGEVGQHPLSCLHSVQAVMSRDDKGQDIFWKKDGVTVRSGKGNIFYVQLEESSGGGNYTCHSKDGSLLNHTVVLVHEDQTKRKKILVQTDHEFLKCSAVNYNGEFHCSWTWHHRRIGKVAFIKAQRVSSDQRTLSCSVDDSGHGVSCLDAQHCPYAEETEYIHITVYVSSDFLLENYSKHFYLFEIVKPDSVQISKVNTTAIEWTYPSSWASPYTYFPLTFQIAKLRRGCENCGNPCNRLNSRKIVTINCTDSCSCKIKSHTKTVCFRAKDALSNSEWSEWSPFIIKEKRKNRRKRSQ